MMLLAAGLAVAFAGVASPKHAGAATFTVNFSVAGPASGFGPLGLGPGDGFSGSFTVEDATVRPNGFADITDLSPTLSLTIGGLSFDESNFDSASTFISFSGDALSEFSFSLEKGDILVKVANTLSDNNASVIDDGPADISGGCEDCVTFTTGTAAVPVPAALPLFATGLGVLGFVGWRRRGRA